MEEEAGEGREKGRVVRRGEQRKRREEEHKAIKEK